MMAWSPFSAEAIELHGKIRRFDKEGRITAALQAIEEAMEKAHRDGPSNTTYEEFERMTDAP